MLSASYVSKLTLSNDIGRSNKMTEGEGGGTIMTKKKEAMVDAHIRIF